MLPHKVEQIPEWITRRLAAAPQRIVSGDSAARASRAAAVLIPIVLHASGPTVLLTERATHLSQHAGQVSFPGGAVEDADADCAATALRETEEEVGIAAGNVKVLACLGEYHTISGFCVTPVVGVLTPPFAIKPDPQEVADVFELPLSVLLNRSLYEKRWVQRGGQRAQTHFLEYDNRVVWGATAGILLKFSLELALQGIPRDLTV
jgi:8-oxo-dGTP pyrophosphatase MutT (NUDIX family)